VLLKMLTIGHASPPSGSGQTMFRFRHPARAGQLQPASAVRRSESPNHVLTATLRIRRTVTRRTRQSYIGDYASSSARAWIAPFTGSDICVDRTQRSNHRSSDVMPACLSRCWVIAAESVTVTVAGNLNSKGPRRFLAGTDAPTECKQ
jgi:hypothetical protein